MERECTNSRQQGLAEAEREEEVMKMRLSREPKVKYSPLEQKMFSLLDDQDFTSSDDLIKKLYENDEVPFNARHRVNALLANLGKKMVANDEPIELERETRDGPNPTGARLRRKQ
jgi:hypothetical protein